MMDPREPVQGADQVAVCHPGYPKLPWYSRLMFWLFPPEYRRGWMDGALVGFGLGYLFVAVLLAIGLAFDKWIR